MIIKITDLNELATALELACKLDADGEARIETIHIASQTLYPSLTAVKTVKNIVECVTDALDFIDSDSLAHIAQGIKLQKLDNSRQIVVTSRSNHATIVQRRFLAHALLYERHGY